MLPVATIGRTYAITATGTRQALPIPAADLEWVTVLLTSPAAFNFAFNLTDPLFPVAANSIIEVPVQRGQAIYVTGSDVVSIAAMGYGAKAGWQS